ncbi:hypothetical protein H4O20_07070 [Aequorivita sp. 609]|uniref:hypothetical protein n=1 Tax=Aequorivita TaxID=153265 RepID=UPI00161F428E|nr:MULTISPECIES: hypothetical protein [Aequorivita]MBB6681202.1 hypothetical protein [Aequorivita sp. 609]
MKKTILLLSLLLLTSIMFAQNSTDELTSNFFEKYKSNTDEAFDYIFGTNKWMGENKDGTEKVKFQLREYANLMGEYIGFEKLTEKSLGESLKVSVYLVKYDRQPLRFIFKYYKGKKDWMLYNLKFDEDIDDELEEIMKYDYLNGN